MLRVNEIFKSIQGESSYQGLPCIFVRLAGCNLRCLYCDTSFAYDHGTERSVDEVVKRISDFSGELVEVTGGEPLFQKDSYDLVKELLDKGYNVLLETNGTVPLKDLDKRLTVIMDLKTPSSGMSEYTDWDNIKELKETDQIKFVIGDRNDYTWSKDIVEKHNLAGKCHLLFSPVYKKLPPEDLAQWILEDNLNVRLNLQIHKYIWTDCQEGVRCKN